MGVLGKKTIQRVTLTSTASLPVEQQDWVDINTTVATGQLIDLLGDDLSDTQRGLKMLSRMITAWSFTDEAGVPVEPSEDALKLLSPADFAQLSEFVQTVVAPDGGDPAGHEKKAPVL